MRIIEKLSKQIKEELADSRKYAQLAMQFKEDNKELADLYHTLAGEEMSHSERLHKAVVREIEKYKASGKEIPPAMQTIWDWKHREIIEESTDGKMLLELYRK